MTIVLASASPRRRELLRAAGYDCEVRPGDADETRLAGEPAAEYVERLALAKAGFAARSSQGLIVVGADTAVVVEDEVFGKPRDAADATRMLRRLSGRAHAVMTGVAVVGPAATRVSFVETTTVWFRAMHEAEIEWYVASGEPADKAGAYAIQGLASRFVPRIEGCYANVVGLPMARLAAVLSTLQTDTPVRVG